MLSTYGAIMMTTTTTVHERLPQPPPSDNKKPVSPPTDTEAKKHSIGLLDLPSDLHDLLLRPFHRPSSHVGNGPSTQSYRSLLSSQLHSGYLPVASLIDLACTCRTAAHLVLPRLYSNLHIASLGSLPVLFDTLARESALSSSVAQGSIANHVLGITLLPNFLVTRDQFDRVETALANAKITPGSFIPSVHQALARCGPDVLQSLPMVWLTRLATACPNLVSVDLSHLPIEQFRFPPCIMFGFLNLAYILRERRGRFIAPEDDVFVLSAVLVTDPSRQCHPIVRTQPTKTPYCVKSMDWGRQEMSLDNTPMTAAGTYFLVPFSDITSKNPKQQAQWRVRHLGSRHLGPFEPPKPLCTSKDQVWKELGIRMDEDHVFDLQKHRPTGQITVPAFCFADVDRRLSKGFGLDTRRDCAEATIIGMFTDKEEYPTDEIYQFELRATQHDIESQFATGQPWISMTRLTIVNTLFFAPDNVGQYLHTFSTSMPNLQVLDLRTMPLTLDLVLFACDDLVRRPSNPLRELFLECVYAPINPHPASSPRVTPPVTDPRPDYLTPLDMTRATAGHLHRLSLTYVGRGPHGLSRDKPSVLMHPGLLHGVRDLTLQGVMVHVSPPHLAGAYHASFLPYCILQRPTPAPVPGSNLSASFNYLPSLPLKLTRLPGLRRLEVNAASLPYMLLPSSSVASCLPRAPDLCEFVFTDSPQFEVLPWKFVVEVLARYPKLRRASFWKTGLTRKDADKAAMWLRAKDVRSGLVLENSAKYVDGTLVSAPHVASVKVLPSASKGLPGAVVELLRTSVEAQGKSVGKAALADRETKCACGLIAPPTKFKDADYEHLPDPSGLPLAAHLVQFGIRPAQGRALIKDDMDKTVQERCVVCGQDRLAMFEAEGVGSNRVCLWLR